MSGADPEPPALDLARLRRGRLERVRAQLRQRDLAALPWFQETGRRRLEDSDLVAPDTDVVGPRGYYADFSRTFFCGAGRPSRAQRTLFGLAFEQVQTNLALLRPE